MKASKKIHKTNYYSWRINALPKGCQLCVKGEKTVLFITGICGEKCFFCPISDIKKNKDVIYANEKPITQFSELAEEIKLCDSKGVGITGGDPLCKIKRTVEWIKKLKKRFGKKFHVHLYTPLTLVNENILKLLYGAGLDEIRFHLKLDEEDKWKKIELAKKYDWQIGVEIPIIPGKEKQIKRLIDFIEGKIDFLNINELELSDTNASKLVEQGFCAKNKLSYGVKGSEEMAKKLLKYSAKYCSGKGKIKIHYCTTTLKDRVQLANRIKRRAKQVRKKYDIMEKDGTLIRGAIYLDEIKPGMGYLKKLEQIKNSKNYDQIIFQLKTKLNKIKKEFCIPDELIEIDENKLRILTGAWIVEELKNELKKEKLVCAVVHEYPTWDALQLEVEFL